MIQLNLLIPERNVKCNISDTFTNRNAVIQVTKEKKKGSKARQQRLANLLLMSYSCREAWQILTHQLFLFLPYEERQNRSAREQYKSHMPAADSYVMLTYCLLFAHNTLLQFQVPALNSCPVWTLLNCFVNKMQTYKEEQDIEWSFRAISNRD